MINPHLLSFEILRRVRRINFYDELPDETCCDLSYTDYGNPTVAGRTVKLEGTLFRVALALNEGPIYCASILPIGPYVGRLRDHGFQIATTYHPNGYGSHFGVYSMIGRLHGPGLPRHPSNIYLNLDRQGIVGPFQYHELLPWAVGGLLTPQTPYWSLSERDWVPAGRPLSLMLERNEAA